MSGVPVHAVVRLRTLGPSGLNPPQIQVVDRLQLLADDQNHPVTDLDTDVWGASMGSSRAGDQDPGRIQKRVTEFRQWADEHGCTLRPAFDWHSPDSAEKEEERQHSQIVTPLITLAIYEGEHLQAVYPHVDDEGVQTIHDGVEILESMERTGEAKQAEDEISEKESSSSAPVV